MAFNLRRQAVAALILFASCQTSTYALTDYVATGTFFGENLEVIQYIYDFEDDTVEEVFVDAFLDVPPFNVPTSTFTLAFSVDESIDGRVCVFCNFATFDGAISNVSLTINGANVFTSTTEVATVSQFPGDFQGSFPARWSWSLFPEFGGIALPDLSVFDSNTGEPQGSIFAQGFYFGLFDSARQIYSGQGMSFLDMISLNLNDFDDTSFQLFWNGDSDQEPDGNEEEEPPEINYTVFGTVDSLTNVSVVPLPGGIWLLLSALTSIVVATRRTAKRV